MNLGTYLKSEIVVFVPGLNSKVWFCVAKIGSIFKEGSLWTPPLRTGSNDVGLIQSTKAPQKEKPAVLST